MLHFSPVPPSMRQAAGPLTENLPNVCLVNELPVLTDSFRCLTTGASREPSLHQGTTSRLSSRFVCPKARRTTERGLEKGSSREKQSCAPGTRELKRASC